MDFIGRSYLFFATTTFLSTVSIQGGHKYFPRVTVHPFHWYSGRFDVEMRSRKYPCQNLGKDSKCVCNEYGINGKEQVSDLLPHIGKVLQDHESKDRSKQEFSEVSSGLDVLRFLKFIKEVPYWYEGKNLLEHSMYDAQQHFFTIYQGKDANEQEYMEIFNTNIMVLD